MKRPYLTIVCPGHSGSTLFAMCLNSHSNIQVFGEFASLRKRIGQVRHGERKGLCSFCYENCAFFDEKEIRLLRWLYFNRNPFLARAKSIVAHPIYLRHFCRKAGTTIVGDSSKSAHWAEFLHRFHRPFLGLRYVFLFRNPCGVVASHIRKKRDIRDAVAKFRQEFNRLWSFRQTLIEADASSSFLDVAYEDFATDPAAVLERVAGLLDMEFEDGMLEYDEKVHHIVGGNDKARSKAKLKQNLKVNYKKPDMQWYLDQKERFFLDERWRTELTNEQLDMVCEELGEQMQKLGYTR